MSSPAAAASADKKVVRTMRLDEERINALLDSMDERSGYSDRNIKRERQERYSFRGKSVIVHLQQPGGVSTPFYVHTRNISAGGIAFLHGGFVHATTSCVTQLITLHGTWQNVPGTVKSCRYIESNIHEVNVAFGQPIDVSLFTQAAVHTKILLVEDDAAMAHLVQHHIEKLNGQVEVVEDGERAIEMALNGSHDFILMDMDIPKKDGFEATAQLRAKGYSGLIFAATALTRDEDRKRCIEAGCDRYISKPYDSDTLADLIRTVAHEPLYSTKAEESGMADLINEFVSGLRNQIHDLEAAVAEQDGERVGRIARTLKGQGSGFGFDPISTIAGELESELLGGAPLESLTMKIREFKDLCWNAKPVTSGMT